MRLTMKEKKKAAAVPAPRYQKARKKDKGLAGIAAEYFLTKIGHFYFRLTLDIRGLDLWILNT